MTSKNTDDTVNERRLRPIYDWLDNGNNKKALQEADKVLKRTPNLQCAKVLKALALIRLCRSEEADVILKELQKEEPDDDATLQAMAICFRETQQPEMACSVFEAALRKDPSNEEYGSHLFMAYVRVGDYRKQQQAAMNLFKAKPKNPYYFWAVMSIAMQALEGKDAVARTITLPLAERMIKKFITDNKIEAEAEVILHLMVLELQEKYGEALEVLQGPLAQKLSQKTIDTKTGDYLIKLEMWERTVDFFESQLRANPDHWSNYVQYLDAVFHLPDGGEPTRRARDFIVSLVEAEEAKESNKLRGPFLARIHLYQLLKEKGHSDEWLENLINFYQHYVKTFGDKPCCFQDLRPFLSKLPEDKWKMFIDFSENCVKLNDGSSPSDVKQLCRHLFLLQTSRYLKQYASLSADDKVALAQQLWRHYEKTNEMNSQLLATDVRPNDVYVILAAHLLLDAFVAKNGDRDLLFRCLTILETARANSPANFHIKLLTVRVYTLAGYGRAAVRHYESLDIKYIQLDSVGHFLSRPLISMGCPQAASPLLCAALKFYTTHAKETSECLISAYKYGSFEKIPEFTKFRQRLNNSLNFAVVTVERMFIDLLSESSSYAKLVQAASGMTADPDRDQPDWSSLVDNRDNALLLSWDPSDKEDTLNCLHVKHHINLQSASDIMGKTFAAEKDFARLRNRLLHAVVMAICGANSDHQAPGSSDSSQTTNGVHATPDSPSKVLLELEQMSGEFHLKWRSNYSEYDLVTPQIPRIHSYVEGKCLEPLLTLIRFVQQIRSSPTTDECLVSKFKNSLEHLIHSASHPSIHNPLWKGYVNVESLYNAVETVAFCAMLLCSAHALLVAKKSLNKKKKKRDSKDTASDAQLEHYAGFYASLKMAMENLDKLSDTLDESPLLESLSLEPVVPGTEAVKHLQQSRVSDMKAVLHEKLKLVSSCSI